MIKKPTIHEKLSVELTKVEKRADDALSTFKKSLEDLKKANEEIDVQLQIINTEKSLLLENETAFSNAKEENLRVIEKIENFLK